MIEGSFAQIQLCISIINIVSLKRPLLSCGHFRGSSTNLIRDSFGWNRNFKRLMYCIDYILDDVDNKDKYDNLISAMFCFNGSLITLHNSD